MTVYSFDLTCFLSQNALSQTRNIMGPHATQTSVYQFLGVIKTDNTIKIENVRQEDGDIMQRCDTGELTAMCSLVWMGMKPTNEICIDSSVPRQYTYNTQRHRHTSITVEDCRFFLVSLNQLKNL